MNAQAEVEIKKTVGDVRNFVRGLSVKTGSTYYLHVSNLYIDPKFERDEPGDIEGLARNIAEMGFLEDEAILVRPRPDLNMLEVLDGRRRTKASRLATEKLGFDGIVKIIYSTDVKTEADVLTVTLRSQQESKDFTLAERAKFYKMMIEDYGKTADELAKIVGKTVQHVYDTLRFNKIDAAQQTEVQQMIQSGKASETAALTLIKKGIDIKSAPLNAKGKIDVQSATKAATGENKYISPKVFRESLANAKALAKIDTKWTPVVEVLKVMAENQVWGGSLIAKHTINEIRDNMTKQPGRKIVGTLKKR